MQKTFSHIVDDNRKQADIFDKDALTLSDIYEKILKNVETKQLMLFGFKRKSIALTNYPTPKANLRQSGFKRFKALYFLRNITYCLFFEAVKRKAIASARKFD